MALTGISGEVRCAEYILRTSHLLTTRYAVMSWNATPRSPATASPSAHHRISGVHNLLGTNGRDMLVHIIHCSSAGDRLGVLAGYSFGHLRLPEFCCTRCGWRRRTLCPIKWAIDKPEPHYVHTELKYVADRKSN